MLKWHKKLCENWMEMTGMSWHGLVWVSFAKGLLLGALLYWLYDLFFNFTIFM